VSWQRYCASALDATRAGEEFADVLEMGDVVLLSGPLGAGKTTFTKGVAKGLGVIERVTSPTFTMVRPHHCHNDRGIETLHHADVYRVQSAAEVLDLALGELVEEASVAVVEWGELGASVFGRDVISVRFDVDNDEGRLLTVDGSLAAQRARALNEWVAR
jgi:tRNA threonylcarbamoyladenosine biosynthesis protein TsaE